MKLAVFGKSVRGAAHIRAGTKCQDSCRKIVLEDGTAILAAADGHGSPACPHSRTGAKIAANLFCGIMRQISLNCGGREHFISLLSNEGSLVVRAIEIEWKKRVMESHAANGRPFPERDAAPPAAAGLPGPGSVSRPPAYPCARGPSIFPSFHTLLSTYPAKNPSSAADRATTVATKYRISSMAWSNCFRTWSRSPAVRSQQ